jgi:hypothetical protein
VGDGVGEGGTVTVLVGVGGRGVAVSVAVALAADVALGDGVTDAAGVWVAAIVGVFTPLAGVGDRDAVGVGPGMQALGSITSVKNRSS